MAEQIVCVPRRMQNKRKDILRARVTLIEAGAGYGKTTIIKKFFDGISNVWWHVSAMENTTGNYIQLCRVIREFAPIVGEQMEQAGLPNRINASERMALLEQITLSEDTYLVLDNAQLFLPVLPRACISALINHHCPKLHVILLSHYMGDAYQLLADSSQAVCITRDDLLMSIEDIQCFFEQNGLKYDRSQIHKLYQETQGWDVAVSLHLRRALEEEDSAPESGLNAMLDQLVWRKLSDENRARLLAYGFFDTLNAAQLCLMEQSGQVLEEVRLLLGAIPMVNYDDRRDQYDLHLLLRTYLEMKLSQDSSPVARKACMNAARWYVHIGDTAGAVFCYWRIRLWEEILAMDLRGLVMIRNGAISFEEIALQIACEASEELKIRYPENMLYLAYCLFGAGRFDAYQQLLNEMRQIIERSGDQRMMGEWFLISAFSDFPDLEAMGEKYRQALEYMQGCRSCVIRPEEPYFFGCISMWALFYTKSGEMEKNCEVFSRVLADYSQLTGGNGTGADEIYRGECLCVQGRFDEAEICAFKAEYAGEQAGQISMVYAAVLLRSIIAVYKGDDDALKEAVEFLEQTLSSGPAIYNPVIRGCMLDTARGYILGLLLETQSYPQWVHDMGNTPLNLTFSNFMIYQSRVTDLILRKEYRRAIACIETLLGMDARLCSAATRNFMLVGLALCYLAIGRIVKAAEALDQSLTLCAPDHNFTFVARMRKVFAPLFKLPGISGRHAKAIEEIKALKIDYKAPDNDLIFRYIKEEESHGGLLTKREEEVANLAAQGLRNREIADRLYITEATVKSNMKAIFQKLQIDRRSKIMELLH